MVASPLIVPASMRSPTSLCTGIDSPVIGAWFTVVEPKVILESIGIFSPGRTIIFASTFTCSTDFSAIIPYSSTTRATNGVNSINDWTAWRARLIFQDSRSSATENKYMEIVASNQWLIPIAPPVAIIIRRFVSGLHLCNARITLGKINQEPEIIAME